MSIDFAAALYAARTLTSVDEIARAFWAAYGAGNVADEDAEITGSRIEDARRRIKPVDTVRARAPGVPLAAVSMFPPRRRRCVSPDRAASRARRRRLAFSGPLPPALAVGFTVGQLAALRIIADEVRARGSCALTLGEIAARAGVCVTLARNAIRLAAGDGLLVIVERRRHGAPSLPNVVKVISREWRAWIERGRGGGCNFPNPTDSSYQTAVPRGANKNADRLRRAASPQERDTKCGKGGVNLQSVVQKSKRPHVQNSASINV